MEHKNDPGEHLNTVILYSKHAVGGESKEVPTSALDENDNFIHRRTESTKTSEGKEKVETPSVNDLFFYKCG